MNFCDIDWSGDCRRCGQHRTLGDHIGDGHCWRTWGIVERAHFAGPAHQFLLFVVMATALLGIAVVALFWEGFSQAGKIAHDVPRGLREFWGICFPAKPSRGVFG
jgi:hypothetical protein